MEVHKYHALGNDYLVYDPKTNAMELNEERIRLICDRHFGVGSDGILCGPVFRNGTPSVRIYNPDGSEAEKSGSGVRIFSKYLKDAGYVSDRQFTLSTIGGDVDVEFLNESGDVMKVFMGTLTFQSSKIPVAGADRIVVDEPMEFGGNNYRATCVSIGNPHCVIPMDGSINNTPATGAMVENSELSQPHQHAAPQSAGPPKHQIRNLRARRRLHAGLRQSSCATAGAAQTQSCRRSRDGAHAGRYDRNRDFRTGRST